MIDGETVTDDTPVRHYMYVGTFTAPHTAPGAEIASTARGIYVYELSEEGAMSLVQVIEADNPSSLTTNQNKNILYSVHELGEDEGGQPLGRVSAYCMDPSSGKLSFLNSQPTSGTWPCHCSVHPSGRYLLAANYGSGNFSVFPIQEDGSLSKLCYLTEECELAEGHDPGRQLGSHAHMIDSDTETRRVFGTDLGRDRIWIWTMDETTGELNPADIPFVQSASGNGPRHMEFHPDNRRAYVLNELSSSIDVFDVKSERGSFIWLQAVSMLPGDTDLRRPNFDPTNPGKVPEGTNTAAEIRIHPSGKWVYATNRGMNTIAVFAVHPLTGCLVAIEWVDTCGQIPRGMNIDPTGTFLCVGNQDSGTIVIFKIDLTCGILGRPVHETLSPTPVDILFGRKIKK